MKTFAVSVLVDIDSPELCGECDFREYDGCTNYCSIFKETLEHELVGDDLIMEVQRGAVCVREEKLAAHREAMGVKPCGAKS